MVLKISNQFKLNSLILLKEISNLIIKKEYINNSKLVRLIILKNKNFNLI